MSDIELVRALTGNDKISDDVVAFYLDSVEQFILGYCNIKTIPKELKPTLIEITALRVRANSNGPNAAIGEGIKTVGSVTDGQQSVSYQVGATFKGAYTNEEILVAYGPLLDRWRKMVVSRPETRPLGARKIGDEGE